MITNNARGRQITMPALNRIELVRPPDVGKRWYGIPHGKLVGAVEHELEKLGWIVSTKRAYVSSNELELAAEIEVIHDRYPVPIEDSCWTLGIRHGNGHRQGTRFYYGLTMGFDEGFVGHELSSPMNSPMIVDLKKDIPKIIHSFEDLLPLIVLPTIQDWLEKPIDNNIASRLLIRAGEHELLPSSRVYRAIQSFNKLPELDWTVWNLHMAFAKQVKRSPPLKQMHHLNCFRWLIEEELHSVAKS